MIPLKDSPKTRTFPYVNITIIVINILVFVRQLSVPYNQIPLFYQRFGVVPSDLVSLFAGISSDPTGQILSVFTTMFLHGGWLHLGGNMLYLWIFGDNVEDRIGHTKYLLFYLLTGIIATTAQVISDPVSSIPIIGASGAVAGILGAYLVSCPKARVLALIPVFFFVTLAEISAVIFLLFWFVLQVISGVMTSAATGASVAWWAHIGGFVAGMVLVNFFGKRLNCQ